MYLSPNTGSNNEKYSNISFLKISNILPSFIILNLNEENRKFCSLLYKVYCCSVRGMQWTAVNIIASDLPIKPSASGDNPEIPSSAANIIDVHRNHLADNFINSDWEISQSNKILVKWSLTLIVDAGSWSVLIFMFCWWWWWHCGIARIRLFNCENFGKYELTLILTEAWH